MTALRSIFKQWGIRGLSRVKNDAELMMEAIEEFDPRIIPTVKEMQYEAGKRRYREVERAYQALSSQAAIPFFSTKNVERQAKEVLGEEEEEESEIKYDE